MRKSNLDDQIASLGCNTAFATRYDPTVHQPTHGFIETLDHQIGTYIAMDDVTDDFEDVPDTAYDRFRKQIWHARKKAAALAASVGVIIIGGNYLSGSNAYAGGFQKVIYLDEDNPGPYLGGPVDAFSILEPNYTPENVIPNPNGIDGDIEGLDVLGDVGDPAFNNLMVYVHANGTVRYMNEGALLPDPGTIHSFPNQTSGISWVPRGYFGLDPATVPPFVVAGTTRPGLLPIINPEDGSALGLYDIITGGTPEDLTFDHRNNQLLIATDQIVGIYDLQTGQITQIRPAGALSIEAALTKAQYDMDLFMQASIFFKTPGFTDNIGTDLGAPFSVRGAGFGDRLYVTIGHHILDYGVQALNGGVSQPQVPNTDLDGDGDTDLADAAGFQVYFDDVGSSPGDFNDDEIVDLTDFEILQVNTTGPK